MLDDDTWAGVEAAINNFPVVMAGIMIRAAALSASGSQPDAPAADPGPPVRAMVADRAGKPQLDPEALGRIRAGLDPRHAADIIDACAAFARGLPPLTAALTQADLLAYIERPGPGDPDFEAFMARFMPAAQRIQALVHPTPDHGDQHDAR